MKTRKVEEQEEEGSGVEEAAAGGLFIHRLNVLRDKPRTRSFSGIH